MKQMRRIIRSIVNWAYSTDIGTSLILLWQSRENLTLMLKDAMLRSAIKGGTGAKEEDLHLHFNDGSPLDKFANSQIKKDTINNTEENNKIDENTGLGWILNVNPEFWEDNGYMKIDSSNYHYLGCYTAKANKRPVYRKRLYVNYDFEEEAEVVLFTCDICVICNHYLVSILEWNNAGDTGYPLRCVKQVNTVKQFNELIREQFPYELDNGTFLLTI